MNNRLLSGLMSASAALLAAGTARAADGALVAPPEAGFVEGYAAATTAASIREEVPAGESVEKWSRMITTQRFGGLAGTVSAAAFLDGIVQRLGAGCPGAVTTTPVALRVGGRPAARMRAACPLNPQTGQPETFWIVVVEGPVDLHVRQAAIRRAPDAGSEAWAARVLGGTRWCAAPRTAAMCLTPR